jgi:ATP-binding cassette subfamily B protein
VRLFQPHRWWLLALFAVAIAGSTLTLLPVVVIGRMVNVITPDPETGELGDSTTLLTLVVIAAAMYIAAGLLGVFRTYITQRIGQSVMYAMRMRLHDQLQRQSLRFHTNTQTGEILSRVTTDVNQIEQAVTLTLSDFVVNLVTLAIAIMIMFALEWRLALLATLTLPLWLLPIRHVGMYQRRLRRMWQEESASMASHLDETLSISGAMLVRSFGRQQHEAERFAQSNARLRALSMQRVMAGRWFNMATELFGSMALVAVFALGGLAVLEGHADLGVIVAFSVLVQKVFQPFASIARINTTLISSLALFERLFEYIDLPVEVGERPGARALRGARGHIRFEGVTFAYDEGEPPVLEDVNLEVAPGQMVALVGPSGAGKTTVTYLLERFYDPQQGRVLIDGNDLRDLTLDSVARTVGAVMQEAYLFHASLADNIRYGRLEATDEEVRDAALTAGLADLIEELPEGLTTVVGERGYRLSGGQKQRVSLARAILKDPPVLVLDEATASLDSRLEREIREATERLAVGRSTVVIAHRLSTVLAADAIFVLDRGRIVERGTHHELLARGGLYATLYREQFATDGVPRDAAARERQPGSAGLASTA